MKFKLVILKKVLLKLASFMLLIGATILLDIYFEEHPVELDEIQTASDQDTNENSFFYLYSPPNSMTVKISPLKTPSRILFEQSHNKLLQKYHQQHKFQVLKTEAKTLKNRLVLTFLHMVVEHYFFIFPDDEPYIHTIINLL